MNPSGIVSAIFKGGRQDGKRARRKHDFLIFLRRWKFEIDGAQDPAKLVGRFTDKLRFFVFHKTAIETDFQGQTRSAFDDLANAVCHFAPDQLEEVHNGQLIGRDRLLQAIVALISFAEQN